MEPLAVGAVVALVARYAEHLADGEAETPATDRLRPLWDTVTARFSGDPVAAGALRRLRAQPGNTKRRGAVEDHLEELAENEPEFALSLATLLRAATGTEDGAGTARDDGAGGAVADVPMAETRGGPFAAGRYVKVDGPFIPAARPSIENG
ncbi:hypothetical protein AB0D99_16285 [Streptomyces sp. NPDC047971]|uniref:hypothetical protein n=1 Tax=Streptomyces sp. NPDC047971 TaxID=3154499 RepID=UPI0033D8DE5C